MTGTVLSLIPTALAWIAVAYELAIRGRQAREPGGRAFQVGLFFLALALTDLLPPVAVAIDRLAGVANLSRLLGHVLVLTAAWAVQVYLIQLNYPDERGRWRVQRRASTLLGTVALLVMFFALAPVHREALDFWGRYQRAPYILEYRLVFVAYLGWALATVVHLCWRYAGITDHPATATGLRLVAIGGFIGLVYCVHEGLRVMASAIGVTNGVLDSNLVTQILIATGVGLMVIGSTMPAWGPRVGVPELVSWFRRYRAYRHLYPLWHALYEASPDIALLPPRSRIADVLTVRDLDFRLYRRVVEIRDGLLAVRPYREPEVVTSALELCREAGLDQEETPLIAEAAALAVALDAKRRGEPGAGGAASAEVAGGADLASEVLALERLARCYVRSRIVRDIQATAQRGRKHTEHRRLRGARRA